MLIEAKPYEYSLNLDAAALLIIDMQRDFLEPGGFGEMLGNDVSQLRRTIEPNKALLAAWRAAGGLVIHTREGHRPDLGRPAAGEENPWPQRDCHRRLRPDGPHPGARRGRPRHHPGTLSRAPGNR